MLNFVDVALRHAVATSPTSTTVHQMNSRNIVVNLIIKLTKIFKYGYFMHSSFSVFRMSISFSAFSCGALFLTYCRTGARRELGHPLDDDPLN